MSASLEDNFVELIWGRRGAKMALTSKEIAMLLGIEDTPGTVITRAFIRRVIIERGLPVGANESGYYWMDSENELKAYLANLAGRINKITERMEAVEKNYYDRRRPFFPGFLLGESGQLSINISIEGQEG